MGIIDTIRKFFRESEEKPIEQIIEIHEKNLDSFIQENEKKRQEIKNSIIKQVSDFDFTIKENIKILENIDLKERKEDEKIKLLVRENLKLYLDYIERLRINLKNIENLSPEEYFIKINEALSNFHKSSRMAFEKSTILIGEIEKLKDAINHLARNVTEIFNSQENEFKKSKILERIKNLFKEKTEITEKIEELEKSNQDLQLELKRMEKSLEEKKTELEDYKKSDEYTKLEENRKIKEKEREELNKNIDKIKFKIDLKSLARQYHESEKIMNLIKRYQENFVLGLTEDNTLELEKLSGIELKKIKEKILEKEDIKDNVIEEINENIKRINLETETKNKEINENNERKEKLSEKIEEHDKEIKNLSLEIR